MAIWNNITNQTNLPALAFSRYLNEGAADTVLKQSPLISLLLNDLPAGESPFESKCKQTKIVSGGRGELKFRGALPAVVGVSNPGASVTTTYDDTRYGSAEFRLTHYANIFDVAVSQIEFISGDSAKADFLELEIQTINDAFFAQVAGDFHGTADQTVSAIGGWRRALQTDDTLGTWLGFSRASDNAGLRANLDVAGTALSIARLEAIINQCVVNNGRPDVALMGAANFGLMQTAVEPVYRVVTDRMMKMGYGSIAFNIAGVDCVLDGYCPATSVAVLDSSSWYCVMKENGFGVSDMVRNTAKVAMMSVGVDMYIAIVTDAPRKNGRITTN